MSVNLDTIVAGHKRACISAKKTLDLLLEGQAQARSFAHISVFASFNWLACLDLNGPNAYV